MLNNASRADVACSGIFGEDMVLEERLIASAGIWDDMVLEEKLIALAGIWDWRWLIVEADDMVGIIGDVLPPVDGTSVDNGDKLLTTRYGKALSTAIIPSGLLIVWGTIDGTVLTVWGTTTRDDVGIIWVSFDTKPVIRADDIGVADNGIEFMLIPLEFIVLGFIEDKTEKVLDRRSAVDDGILGYNVLDIFNIILFFISYSLNIM